MPSINSKKAPPPVEQYDTSSLSMKLFIAVNVSPPPANEKALELAIIFDKSFVPFENFLFSNTPIPFYGMAHLEYLKIKNFPMGQKTYQKLLQALMLSH